MNRGLIALVLLSLMSALPGVASAIEKVPLARTEGAPTIVPGGGPGYWLWHDATGWHLRWTGSAGVPSEPGGVTAGPVGREPGGVTAGSVGREPGGVTKKSIFSGLIQVQSAKIAYVKPAGMTGGDDSCNRLDAGRAMFKSEAAATVEGVDFKTGEGATSLYLELFGEYDVIAPATVHLGKDATPATDIVPSLQIDLQPQAPGAP